MRKQMILVTAAALLAACSGKTNNTTPSSSLSTTTNTAVVSVEFANEANYDSHTEAVLDADNTDLALLISTDQAVTDFELVNLAFVEASQEGEITWQAESAYAQDELTADIPLLAFFPSFGDMPSYGMAYTDTDGTRKSYAIGTSGKDGSLYLEEATFLYNLEAATITAEFAPDILPENTTKCVITKDDTYLGVLFTTDQTVTDFNVLTLSILDSNEDGAITWEKTVAYTVKEFTPGKPLAVYAPNPGDLPSLGIEYTDATGITRFFVISISGYDGSLLMTEFENI